MPDVLDASGGSQTSCVAQYGWRCPLSTPAGVHAPCSGDCSGETNKSSVARSRELEEPP